MAKTTKDETEIKEVSPVVTPKLEDTPEFKELMLKTGGELKDILSKEFEFVGAEFMNDKKAAVATILSLRKKIVVLPETPSVNQPANGEVAAVPVVPQNDLRVWASKKDKFKAFCETQPKVSTMIPFEIGEKPGAYAELQINGYKLNVMKGVYVELPRPFADLVRQSWQQTADAGKDMILDRIDPQTGKPYKDSEALV
jgi:hypothetical protein